MAEILPFPIPSAPPRLPAAPPGAVQSHPPSPGLHGAPSLRVARPVMNVRQRRFMDMGELAAKLGLDRHTRRTIIDRLRLLHDQAGMPAPHLPRQRGGRLLYGADAIWAGAIWDRGTMLIWLDRPIGPGGAAAPVATPPLAAERDAMEVDRLAARAVALLAAAPARRAVP